MESLRDDFKYSVQEKYDFQSKLKKRIEVIKLSPKGIPQLSTVNCQLSTLTGREG